MLKKSLSLFLALVLSLSMTVVAMAESVPGGTTVTGDGGTTYVDTEKYVITLPTSAALNFKLDPLGLTDIASGGVTDLDNLKGGKIISTSNTSMVNNSSVPVKITATIKGTELTASDVTFMATSAVSADTANNVAVLIVPSSANMPTASAGYTPISNGFALSTTDIVLDFALPAAKWEVTFDGVNYGVALKPDTGFGTGLKIAGYCNPKADWTDFIGTPTKGVGISAVFTIAKDTATYTATSFDTNGSYRMLTTLATAVPNGLGAVPASTPGFANISDWTFVHGTSSATNLSKSFNFDSKAFQKAELFSNAACTGTAAYVLVPADYVVTANTFEIKRNAGAFGPSSTAGTYWIKVTIANAPAGGQYIVKMIMS